MRTRAGVRGDGPSRRDLLRALAVAPLAAACGDNIRVNSTIAIVGGGLAGLTTASFLALAGVRADVYEASSRIGGRMLTEYDVNTGGNYAELGGEIVDETHEVVFALCASYGVALDYLPNFDANLPAYPLLHFQGRVVEPFEVDLDLDAVRQKLAAARDAVMSGGPSGRAELERIDRMSISEWLEREIGLSSGSMLRALIEVALVQEKGLDATEQSAWNLLMLTEPHDLSRRLYRDSFATYHMSEGSSALPNAIAQRLGDRIHLEHRLTRVVADGGLFRLTFATPTGDVDIEAEHVVYALPFSVLRDVDLAGAELSETKRRAIAELAYGTHASLVMQFSSRYWLDGFLSGTVLTDVGQLQGTHDQARGQVPFRGILCNLVGGARGVEMGTGSAEEQAQRAQLWIESLLVPPQGQSQYIPGTALRMHWPTHPHTRGSVACYRVGQWSTLWGTEGAREGNQHFCGEHCSEDFQGTMEGAAETGALVAAEVLDDLGVRHPAALSQLLEIATAGRRRASYHAGFGRRMTLADLRRRG